MSMNYGGGGGGGGGDDDVDGEDDDDDDKDFRVWKKCRALTRVCKTAVQ